ncbi:MAG: hypothetical protein K6F00_10320, partial [Lachnospiraceae bacterium]|nr:hypothetical protein [Lachnospiraceae bacterium]
NVNAAIRLSKRTDYFPSEIKRERARNRLCRLNDIRFIRILYPGAESFGDCICIRREDKTWKASEYAVNIAFEIMKSK